MFVCCTVPVHYVEIVQKNVARFRADVAETECTLDAAHATALDSVHEACTRRMKDKLMDVRDRMIRDLHKQGSYV